MKTYFEFADGTYSDWKDYDTQRDYRKNYKAWLGDMKEREEEIKAKIINAPKSPSRWEKGGDRYYVEYLYKFDEHMTIDTQTGNLWFLPDSFYENSYSSDKRWESWVSSGKEWRGRKVKKTPMVENNLSNIEILSSLLNLKLNNGLGGDSKPLYVVAGNELVLNGKIPKFKVYSERKLFPMLESGKHVYKVLERERDEVRKTIVLFRTLFDTPDEIEISPGARSKNKLLVNYTPKAYHVLSMYFEVKKIGKKIAVLKGLTKSQWRENELLYFAENPNYSRKRYPYDINENQKQGEKIMRNSKYEELSMRVAQLEKISLSNIAKEVLKNIKKKNIYVVDVERAEYIEDPYSNEVVFVYANKVDCYVHGLPTDLNLFEWKSQEKLEVLKAIKAEFKDSFKLVGDYWTTLERQAENDFNYSSELREALGGVLGSPKQGDSNSYYKLNVSESEGFTVEDGERVFHYAVDVRILIPVES